MLNLGLESCAEVVMRALYSGWSAGEALVGSRQAASVGGRAGGDDDRLPHCRAGDHGGGDVGDLANRGAKPHSTGSASVGGGAAGKADASGEVCLAAGSQVPLADDG